MEQLITVATFNERPPAEHLAARLCAAGLPAELYDESHEQKWKVLNFRPRAHLRVRVHTSDEPRALALLYEWQGTEPKLAESLRCPECGSSRIEFPQFSRRTLVSAFPAVLAMAGVIAQEYYCQSCHFTWPAETKDEPDLDALNWKKTDKVL